MDNSKHLSLNVFRRWLVVFAASGMGLVLGILYTWSVIKAGIPDSWAWSNADKALPYSMMTIAFSVTMIPAGRFQDRYGPRPVIAMGGILAGLGCLICGLAGDSVMVYVAGFGIVTGAGVGFGYSAITPAAIKWFPPERTGLVTGMVVAGFGLAPVVLAPLAAWLLNLFEKPGYSGLLEKGVSETMIGLGVFIWLVMGSLLWLVSNPPAGFMPRGNSYSIAKRSAPEFVWKKMLSTGQFWLLFFMYFAGASAGLVFISVATDLGRKSLGEWAFIAVVAISFGNTFGRVLAGYVSDKIGRQSTLFCEFVCQGLVIGLLFRLTATGTGGWLIILLVLFLIGMNYGANLTLFPAACKDFFGIRNFGLNYGCLFIAFGTAGLIMPWLNGLIQDITGKQDISYILIISMMGFSAVLALVSRAMGPPSVKE